MILFLSVNRPPVNSVCLKDSEAKKKYFSDYLKKKKTATIFPWTKSHLNQKLQSALKLKMSQTQKNETGLSSAESKQY